MIDSSAITLDGITRSYASRGVPALDTISVSVSAGEFVAIMGPSGSGKSTLLNVMGLLDRPDAGECWIGDMAVNAVRDRDKDELRALTFGFVFQGAHILPDRTVAENVALPLSVRGCPQGVISRRTSESLQHVGLADMAAARASTLSGGERQRVALARALVTHPSVILADEPTGSLDSSNSRQVMGLLSESNARGATVVVVTHDPRVAAYARRTIEVRDGRVVRDTGSRSVAGDRDIHRESPDRRTRLAARFRRMSFTVVDAVGSLMSRPVRTLLLLASFVVGAGGIVAALGISQTAANQVQDQLTAAALDQLFVIPAARSTPAEIYDLAGQIRQVSHVTEVGLRVDVSPSDADASLLPPGTRGARSLEAASVMAADSRYLDIASSAALPRSAWLLDEGGQGDVALVGANLAERLGIGSAEPGKAVWALGRPYDVVGVMNDDNFANALVLSDPYLLAAGSAGVDAALVVRTVPGYPASVAELLKRFLPPSARVTTAADLDSLRLGVRQDLSALVASVSVIVLALASLSAASALSLSVQARTGEIALRRAIGTPRRRIASRFLLEGGILGLLGGVFGAGMGLCGVVLVSELRDWSPYFEPSIWLYGVLAGVGTGLLAAVVPSARAALLDPAQGLRHE